MVDLKFKVWDKVRCVMTPPMTLQELVQEFKEYESSDWENLEVLRFTGLYDQNLTEIFEGDVVQFELWDGKEVDVVQMRPPVLWLRHEEFGWDGEKLIQPQETEVLGNIYENPEKFK